MSTLGALTPVVVLALAVGSAFFSLVAVVGLYRLPDVYARAHAASKSETLGALLALAAAAVAFGPGPETLKLGFLALFVLVTGPTAAHAIVRSAADAGVEPWTREGGDPEPAPGSPGAAVRADGGTRTGRDHGSPSERDGGAR